CGPLDRRHRITDPGPRDAAGHVQHGIRAARSVDHPQAIRSRVRVSGRHGELAARPAFRLGRQASRGIAAMTSPPAGAIRHPMFPNSYYAPDDDRTVRVTTETRWGRFDSTGRYLEGTLFEADPELCVWV